MKRQPHFELAQGNHGWPCRLIKNGRTILSSGSQVYARRAGAVRAADIADPERRFERVVVDERSRRCQFVSPSPWGETQCALAEGHEERHAFSPSETLS